MRPAVIAYMTPVPRWPDIDQAVRYAHGFTRIPPSDVFEPLPQTEAKALGEDLLGQTAVDFIDATGPVCR